MKRENFNSRIGFILVSAGCAIGIGNVWKFPYLAGQNGGGYFVLFYLLFLIIMGIPVMTMELAVGRASRKSAVLGYKALEPAGSKWHWHGWACVIGCLLLMMYYTTVSGWMLAYFFKFVSGAFTTVTVETSDSVFANMLGNPVEMGIFMAITVAGGLLVCSIVVLAVHSLTRSGAGKGIDFYLRPNMDTIRSVGIFNVITNAMNQAFFTLSLGIAAMEIFGSYMHDDHTLTGEAVRICALDTFVAIMAGLIIFPACFSYNVELDHGPALIFMTLPKIFLDMPGGRVWGSLFFLFMTFASFSTVTAVFENLIASACDNWGWSRKKSVGIVGAVLFLTSIPCVLGYNVWSGFHPMPGKDILDFEDFLVSSLLLPIGSLVYLLFCVSKRGWGFDKYLAECNKGTGIKMSPKFKVYFRYILPILIIIILVVGLVPLFR